MKFYKIIVFISAISFISCSKDFLELEPTDKISAEDLFSSPEGIQSYMANLYAHAPIEDFNSVAPEGLSWNPPWPNNAGFYPYIMHDDAVGSQHQVVVGWGGLDYASWWERGYKFNKDVNLLIDIIPQLDTDQESKDAMKGEAWFLRAYGYYGLAKRFGGVPIITEIADINEGTEGLHVPRSTEKETWDFVLSACDTAALYLGEGDGARKRATKWAALALKSRAALHAASVAKYWNQAPLSGAAVDAGLVGMEASEADRYYAACISASEELINTGPFSLYEPTPSTPEEASENYRQMFENPNRALCEVIFMKGFNIPGDEMGSNQDNWGNPNQTKGSWPHPGRFNPTLDLADVYENYADPGQSAPIVTTVDGDVDNYDGYDPSRSYLEFDHPLDIFTGKDARLSATVILPMSIWKDTEIIIQGGYIQPDGTAVIEADASIDVDGTMYYTYGASSAGFYSGFGTTGYNMTRSGFGFKKFLDSEFVPSQLMNQSTTDYIDFRLAEVILNHAEAVIESGSGDATLASKGINSLRHRAAHQSDIPFTFENVMRERRVELVFENKRYWDLTRRREYHTLFYNTIRHSLVPVLDLRTMKYIFIRKYVFNAVPNTFLEKYYYKIIPGIATNGLTQNPQY
ncbi:MAG: RagB/SusD family nutrient uptake outer membrane protein [Bacteroidota bacterium]